MLGQMSLPAFIQQVRLASQAITDNAVSVQQPYFYLTPPQRLHSHRLHRSSRPRFRLSFTRPLFQGPKANPRPAYADRGFGV